MTAMTSPTSARTYPTDRTFAVSAAARRRQQRALGVGAAVAANSLIYLVARAAGTDFTLTAPNTTQAHPLILPEIAGFSLVFAPLGWGTLALLEPAAAAVRAAGDQLPIRQRHVSTNTFIEGR